MLTWMKTSKPLYEHIIYRKIQQQIPHWLEMHHKACLFTQGIVVVALGFLDWLET